MTIIRQGSLEYLVSSNWPRIALIALLTNGIMLQHPGLATTKDRGRPGTRYNDVVPNPTTPREHNNLGVTLARSGKWEQAINEHEIALKMDPHNKTWQTNLSAVHLEYGKYLFSQKRLAEAASEFRKAMYVDSENRSADAELDKVMTASKHYPQDYDYRRELAQESTDPATTIVEWRKCCQLRDLPINHANLASALIKAGKEIEGYGELKAAVERPFYPADQTNDVSECHFQLGEVLKMLSNRAFKAGQNDLGMKRLSNAGMEYRRAVTLNPANARAIQGMTEVALKAVSLNNTFDNHLSLYGAYQLAGDYAHARQELGFCKKLNPQNFNALSEAWASLYRTMARSLLTSEGQVTQCIDELNEKLANSPDDGKSWATLGLFYLKQKDNEHAAHCFDEAQKHGDSPHKDSDLDDALKKLKTSS